MRSMRFALTALLLLAAAVPGFAQERDAAADAYRSAYTLILEENWAGARDSFEDLLKSYPRSDWSDDAEFWLCYVGEQMDRKQETAFECYQEFLENWEESEWSDDARRNMARLANDLAQQGKPEYSDMLDSTDRELDREGILALLVALANIGDEQSLNVIFDRFEKTEDDALRAEMVQVFHSIDSPIAVDKLIEIVQTDSSSRVREQAVWVLQSTEDRRATEVLVGLATNPDEDRKIRKAAIHSLGDDESIEHVDLLKNLALNDPDPEVAEAAIWALANTERDAAFNALREVLVSTTDPELRSRTLHAISSMETRQTLEFLGEMARTEKDPETLRDVVMAIGNFESHEALQILVEIAKSSPDWRTRATAASAMGEFENAAAVRELSSFLAGEENYQARVAAVHALGETEHQAAVEVLLDVARQDPDSRVGSAAAEALADIGTPEARDALIQLLEGR